MLRFSPLLLLLLSPFVVADVKITGPEPGEVIKVGTSSVSISITWGEGDEAPALADLQTFTLSLCAGGNTAGSWQQIAPLQASTPFGSGVKTAMGTVPITQGDDIENAYFVKMESTSPTGIVTNFSGRFTLQGMTGSFPDAIKLGAEAVTGTNGPDTINAAAAANPAVPGAEQFDVPFGEQTGNVRYAPMMVVPPKKVTKTDKRPLYPASSVQIATTFLKPATIATTITQSQTFSVSSRENTVAAAAMPTDDMARFLNRWKD